MEYVVRLDTEYTTTNSPIVFNMGYVNQKTPTYNCITQIPNHDILVKSQEPDLFQEVTNNVLQSNKEGSYATLIYDLGNAINPPLLYPVKTYQALNINNHDTLLRIFNQELPAVYNPTNQLNLADNNGTVGVLTKVYEYVYELYFNSISSIGVGNQYNPQWELVYVGVNNFLSGAKYPAQLLKTLMQLTTTTGTTRHSIAITLSRVLYQYLGEPIPCEITYNETGKIWEIHLFSSSFVAWLLGINGNTELGQTTTLTSRRAKTNYLWFIYVLAQRLFPAFVKFKFVFESKDNFNAKFNIGVVGDDDYYNPTQLYGAYKVVSNSNTFNTKGYIYA